MKHALVIGANGQDGSYMVELLLKKGYRVTGTIRPYGCSDKIASVLALDNLQSLDLTAQVSTIACLLAETQPDEIYNLAGQTFQQSSWVEPAYTIDIDGLFVMRLIEAIVKVCPKAKLFQASAAGMFGSAQGLCNEKTQIDPKTPYDIGKAMAHHVCQIYRDRGLFVSTGILFSHESPRRGMEMVSRKISWAIAHWTMGSYPLTLGGLDFEKDWGYAPDYVEAMYQMLQVSEPRDYVLGSGEKHSIQDFLTEGLKVAGLDIAVLKNLRVEEFQRRKHSFSGYADTYRAQEHLKFNPQKTSFQELVKIMVEADMREIKEMVDVRI